MELAIHSLQRSLGVVVAIAIAAVATLTLTLGCNRTERVIVESRDGEVRDAAVQVRSQPIVLDGSFEDWKGVPAAAEDDRDAPEAEVDLRTIKVVDDPRAVHAMIELSNVVNVQQLAHGSLHLLFDADGSGETGRTVHGVEGVDFEIEMTAEQQGGRWERPEGIRLDVYSEETIGANSHDDAGDEPANFYDLGFAFAPTYASDTVELRLERGGAYKGVERFTGSHFRMSAVVFDHEQRIVDAVPAFTHKLATSATTTHAAGAEIPVRSGDLRVMSWNAHEGAIIRLPDHFAPLLRAVNPDVLLLQELNDRQSAEGLAEVLNEYLPAESDQRPWQVVFGEGGGNLRSAIAARRPLRAVDAMRTLPYPSNEKRSLRQAAAVISHDGADILLISLHLRCCGGLNTEEDETRMEEAEMLSEAVAALADAQPDLFDGVIVGGDLNLVGSRAPLERIAQMRSGSPMQIAEPMRLDQRSNATWHDREQPFSPGRLDFMLYSPERFRAMNSFVLNAADLDATARSEHHIGETASRDASDHMPVVVDLVVTD